MISPLVSELAVDRIPVTVTCRVLKLARQPYHRWLTHPIDDRDLAEAHVATLLDAHHDDLVERQFTADKPNRCG